MNTKNPIGVKCRRHEMFLKCRKHEISIEMKITPNTSTVGVACLLNSCYNSDTPMGNVIKLRKKEGHKSRKCLILNSLLNKSKQPRLWPM
ncbi:Uncharacterised protein [Sphingobacterium daejeonense]|nr:Uncharacterised protein [Sphingobacterium daejeonense]